MKQKLRLVACSWILVVTGLVGCARSKSPPPVEARHARLQTFCAGQSEEPVSEDVVATARANNRFGMSFYSALSNESKNSLVSAYSMGTLLAMARAGARGNTRAQLDSALAIPAGLSDYEGATQALANQVLCGALRNGYDINVANALWTQNGFSPLPAYTKTLNENFFAETRTLDFRGNAQGALREINQWVNEETRGLIPTLFTSIDPSTRLVLANAVYLKAQWASPFKVADTSSETFYVNGAAPTAVATMHQVQHMTYGQAPLFDWVSVPYTRGESGQGFVMEILLPHARTGLKDVESALAADTDEAWRDQAQYREVRLALPKFKFEVDWKSETLGALRQLGITDAFSGAADFSGIDGGRSLYVNQVTHRTFIEVDEEGTKAAAASGAGFAGGAAGMSGPIDFRVDHPFMFTIRDTQTGMVVFTGHVVNPLAK